MVAMATETLFDRIDRFVSLGYVSPDEIADAVKRELSDDALAVELLGIADEILHEFSRRALSSDRRQKHRDFINDPENQKKEDDLRLSKTWIPSYGWKRTGDCTRADCREVAQWFDHLAERNAVRAKWYWDVHTLMNVEDVHLVRDLSTLPSLDV